MELTFLGGTEVVRLKIDRINKKAFVATSKTGYTFCKIAWWQFFGNTKGDKAEAVKEMAECELLSDSEFKEKIVLAMQKHGYNLENYKG